MAYLQPQLLRMFLAFVSRYQYAKYGKAKEMYRESTRLEAFAIAHFVSVDHSSACSMHDIERLTVSCSVKWNNDRGAKCDRGVRSCHSMFSPDMYNRELD